MVLNARVDVNCGRTENRTPISHLAKADATKMVCISLWRVEIFCLLSSDTETLVGGVT